MDFMLKYLKLKTNTSYCIITTCTSLSLCLYLFINLVLDIYPFSLKTAQYRILGVNVPQWLNIHFAYLRLQPDLCHQIN